MLSGLIGDCVCKTVFGDNDRALRGPVCCWADAQLHGAHQSFDVGYHNNEGRIAISGKDQMSSRVFPKQYRAIVSKKDGEVTGECVVFEAGAYANMFDCGINDQVRTYVWRRPNEGRRVRARRSKRRMAEAAVSTRLPTERQRPIR